MIVLFYLLTTEDLKLFQTKKVMVLFHIRGRDVLDNFESKVIQRFPIYYYLSEDSFTRKSFQDFI